MCSHIKVKLNEIYISDENIENIYIWLWHDFTCLTYKNIQYAHIQNNLWISKANFLKLFLAMIQQFQPNVIVQCTCIDTISTCCNDISCMDLPSIFIPWKHASVIWVFLIKFVGYNLKLAKIRSRHKKLGNCKGRGKSFSSCF